MMMMVMVMVKMNIKIRMLNKLGGPQQLQHESGANAHSFVESFGELCSSLQQRRYRYIVVDAKE